MRLQPAGCSTVRAAWLGLIRAYTSGLRVRELGLVMTLEISLGREQIAQTVVSFNGCSRAAGRRFWKATTWTSAITAILCSAPVLVGPVGRLVVVSSIRTRKRSLCWWA